MNQHYINIKVDREERPDVDKVYMNFVQVTIKLSLRASITSLTFCRQPTAVDFGHWGSNPGSRNLINSLESQYNQFCSQYGSRAVNYDRRGFIRLTKCFIMFQATTGGGGWPMSVFLTPDLKPIFGGTYFPPEDMIFGRPGDVQK